MAEYQLILNNKADRFHSCFLSRQRAFLRGLLFTLVTFNPSKGEGGGQVAYPLKENFRSIKISSQPAFVSVAKFTWAHFATIRSPVVNAMDGHLMVTCRQVKIHHSLSL